MFVPVSIKASETLQFTARYFSLFDSPCFWLISCSYLSVQFLQRFSLKMLDWVFMQSLSCSLWKQLRGKLRNRSSLHKSFDLVHWLKVFPTYYWWCVYKGFEVRERGGGEWWGRRLLHIIHRKPARLELIPVSEASRNWRYCYSPWMEFQSIAGLPQQNLVGTVFIHLGGERLCGISCLSKGQHDGREQASNHWPSDLKFIVQTTTPPLPCSGGEGGR